VDEGSAQRITRKPGNEKFRAGEASLEADLQGFWQWSASNLVSNTMRGVLAEYVVALALGGAQGVRREWEPYDLKLEDGGRIEVKSSAYLQAWHQDRPSRIEFRVGKRRAWSAETNTLAAESRRHADVYVFALLRHEDRDSLDPLDVSQWEFFVVPTAWLDARKRSQHSITLKSLQALAGRAVGYSELK
jgi:hypothetical protein